MLFLFILLFLNYGVTRISDLLAFQMWPSDANTAVFIVFGSAILYVILMALPFMPGIEVGLMLMAMLGIGGIVLVSLCTVLALSLSFLAGMPVPSADPITPTVPAKVLTSPVAITIFRIVELPESTT